MLILILILIASYKAVVQGQREIELSRSSMIDEINDDRVKRLGSSVFLNLDGPPPPSYSNRETYNNNSGIRDGDYSMMMLTHKDYFCRRCYKLCCNNHGIEQPYPKIRTDPPAPFLCPVPGLKLPSDGIRRKSSTDTKPSSSTNSSSFTTNINNYSSPSNDNLNNNDTYTNDNGHDTIPYRFFANTNDEGVPFENYEKTLLMKIYSVLSDNNKNNFEEMARLLGTRNPKEVEEYLHSINSDDVVALCQPIQRHKKSKAKKPKKTNIYGNKTANKAIEYEPCNHDGLCDKDCPCVHNGGDGKGYCEKYCACAKDCKNRFPGCVCTRGCRTSSCPCFLGDRECDPGIIIIIISDLCVSCGVGIHPVALPIAEEHIKKHKSIYDTIVTSLNNNDDNNHDDDSDDDHNQSHSLMAQMNRSKVISEYILCTNASMTRGVR